MNLVSKEEFLKAMGYVIDNGGLVIEDSKLKIQQGDYEYVFNADSVNYKGTGEEFITVSLADSTWTAHGSPAIVNSSVTLDGSSWLERGAVELGGKDFQISGRVFESATDMPARRKIFELYTANDLNISLYSSGAGKNLDLLVNCSGSFDNFSEPATLEQEYTFALKYKQDTGNLMLYVGGELIYQLEVSGLTERQTFNQLILGASVLHDNAAWKGTIANFVVYDGYCEL